MSLFFSSQRSFLLFIYLRCSFILLLKDIKAKLNACDVEVATIGAVTSHAVTVPTEISNIAASKSFFPFFSLNFNLCVLISFLEHPNKYFHFLLFNLVVYFAKWDNVIFPNKFKASLQVSYYFIWEGV